MKIMRCTRDLALGTLAVLLTAPAAFPQSTRGDIQGTVLNDAGEPLPGVMVKLESPVMQGERVELTDGIGGFRFLSVPPGAYEATFSLEGFHTIDQEQIRVNIGGTARLAVTMISVFTEDILVTSESPVVDATSTELGLNLSADQFLDIPTDRDAFAVSRVTPGAQSDDSGTTFYGSTGAENSYYIDGVNTTGIELGQEGKRLNFEFIQEVQVKTAAYGAEYGRAIGGLVNVITKSGGNEFHGDVFAYWDDKSLQSDLSGEAREGAVSGSFQTTDFTRSDFGLDIGGYILRDELWFFAAYDRVENEDTKASLEDFGTLVQGAPLLGDEFLDSTERDLWAGKLTWAISEGHSLSASAFGDPSERRGPLGSLAATPLHFMRSEETGATDQAWAYSGVITSKVFANARYSDHREKGHLTGPGAAVTGYIDLTDPLGDGTLVWGWEDRVSGFGFFQNKRFERQQYNADLSVFSDAFGGSHELGAGYELEDISGVNESWNGGGGQRIYRLVCDPAVRFCGDPVQPYYYRHRFFLPPERVDADPTTLTAADILAPLSVGIKTENEALYVQDTWRPTSFLTLNLGVRWETQQLFNALGEVSADIDDNIAPRLGVVGDPSRTGRAKVFAHWGRFYETIPMDIVIRSFGFGSWTFTYNLSDEPGDVANDPRVRSTTILGGAISPVDPDIEGEYLDEIVVGGEYELTKSWNVGVKYVNRKLESVIEDVISAEGDWFIGNPGRGLMETNYDLGFLFGYNDTLHRLDEPQREFEGVEATVSKRLTKNFQFLASALWSELEGSYDGSFQVSTGQLDPNINSAFDVFDFSVNNEGLLSNDRRWQLKFDGIYHFDFGLTAGLSAYHRTGTPITAMGYCIAANGWEYYLSKRGGFGRVDDDYEVDLHLGYAIKLPRDLELNVLLDVFNLLDVQTETVRETRYTIGEEDYNPIDWLTGETFTIDPGDVENPPTNAAFNTPTRWTDPRRIRLGLRLTF
jgi:hypothetical protein